MIYIYHNSNGFEKSTRSRSENPPWKRKKERKKKEKRIFFRSWQILRNPEEWRAARTSASSSVGRAFFFRLAHRGQKLGKLNSRATKKPLELVRWTSSGLSPLSFPPKSTREDPSHSNVRGYGHECSWIHAGARRWTHRGLSTRMRVLAVVPRKAVETRGNYHPCALVKVSGTDRWNLSVSFFPFFFFRPRSKLKYWTRWTWRKLGGWFAT